MPEQTAPQLAPIAEAPKKIPGLAMGRIVLCRDPFGIERPAMIADVIDNVDGVVSLIVFGRHQGDEAAVLVQEYRYSADGAGHRRWWFPTKV